MAAARHPNRNQPTRIESASRKQQSNRRARRQGVGVQGLAGIKGRRQGKGTVRQGIRGRAKGAAIKPRAGNPWWGKQRRGVGLGWQKVSAGRAGRREVTTRQVGEGER